MNTHRFAFAAGLLAVTAFAQQKPTFPDAEAAKHVGEEATVIGKVFTVSKSAKGMTFLNFGDRYPRHTFSGIVFARDEAAAGDMKQYEGKDVALTGKIEAAPDGKPQIVIKAADQIKLAGSTMPPAPTPAATPTPPPPPATTPMPSASIPVPPPPPEPTPPEPAMPPAKGPPKIALAPNWSSAGQGGEMTRKDLAKVFELSGTPSERIEGDPTIEVYPGVPFLTPLTVAKKTLRLEGSSGARIRVATPGLPRDSFTAQSFSGVFIGGFNRLYLVTDNADQVVSAIAVEENTRARVPNETDTSGFHTYNFITGRTKGTNDLAIRHTIATDGPPGVLVVESMLIDPTDPEDRPPIRFGGKSTSTRTTTTKPKTGKVLERSRWFVPVPIVNLILRCVSR